MDNFGKEKDGKPPYSLTKMIYTRKRQIVPQITKPKRENSYVNSLTNINWKAVSISLRMITKLRRPIFEVNKKKKRLFKNKTTVTHIKKRQIIILRNRNGRFRPFTSKRTELAKTNKLIKPTIRPKVFHANGKCGSNRRTKRDRPLRSRRSK